MSKPTSTIRAHGVTLKMYQTGGKTDRCWRRGVPYERPLLESIYDSGFTGCAVDAGAGIGNHTLWLAGVCGLQVTAFEPIRHEVVRRNVELNGLESAVRIHPFALGEKDGSAAHLRKGQLSPNEESFIRHVICEGPGHTPKPGGNVEVRRLDDFNLRDVSVMKIDVEGMEPHVLRGAKMTILRDRPVIFAETWSSKEHDAISAVLKPWRYTEVDRLSSKESPTPVVRWEPA